jgi:hypothetical protein
MKKKEMRTSPSSHRATIDMELYSVFDIHQCRSIGGSDLDPESDTENENAYHIAANGWTEVAVSRDNQGSIPPSPRSLHAAALLNGVMHIFAEIQRYSNPL